MSKTDAIEDASVELSVFQDRRGSKKPFALILSDLYDAGVQTERERCVKLIEEEIPPIEKYIATLPITDSIARHVQSTGIEILKALAAKLKEQPRARHRKNMLEQN